MKYSFENLKVWQKSRELVILMYKVTNTFPPEERFGLTSQIRRSAISVSSNIAEGSTRWSKKDKARFYEIAFGSLIEVLNQVIIANDLGFVKEPDIIESPDVVDHVGRMLNALYQDAKH